MTQRTYVGIDLAMAKRKRLPACACTMSGGSVIPLSLTARGLVKTPAGMGNRLALEEEVVERFACETVAYLRELEATLDLDVVAVAIGAPKAPRANGLPRRAADGW